ncbi:DUF4058 family protein [Gemmata sp.]|uniref:DUF4058 family protein n=1 Tax=Gemmata sp. TaxID=1914242 RepID=UPI003F70858E
MPLRDHFRPPVSKRASWEGLHGGWPMVIVQQLRKTLPPGFIASPSVRLGSFYEIDVATYEPDEAQASPRGNSWHGSNGATTVQWDASEPSVAIEVEPDEEYEYAVHVYDAEREQTLVAAIEIVSPANKDRPEKRNSFVAKCAALLRQGVSVCVVDLVTNRQFNLYTELMAFIGHGRKDPMSENPPATYAASCRWGPRGDKSRLETWSRVMTVGQPLPSLPLWLRADLAVTLDLEATYEQACHDLWIE